MLIVDGWNCDELSSIWYISEDPYTRYNVFRKGCAWYVPLSTKIEKATDPWLEVRADATVVICIGKLSAAQCYTH